MLQYKNYIALICTLFFCSVQGQEIKSQQELLGFYPNPVSNGKLFLTSKSTLDKEVVIFDVLGKKVISTLSKSSKEKLQLAGIKPGVYFVVIKNASGKTNTQKFVIEQ
jgi:hypothetical protein